MAQRSNPGPSSGHALSPPQEPQAGAGGRGAPGAEGRRRAGRGWARSAATRPAEPRGPENGAGRGAARPHVLRVRSAVPEAWELDPTAGPTRLRAPEVGAQTKSRSKGEPGRSGRQTTSESLAPLAGAPAPPRPASSAPFPQLGPGSAPRGSRGGPWRGRSPVRPSGGLRSTVPFLSPPRVRHVRGPAPPAVRGTPVSSPLYHSPSRALQKRREGGYVSGGTSAAALKPRPQNVQRRRLAEEEQGHWPGAAAQARGRA